MAGLNIIGNIQDSLNTISGEKRKFAFIAGSLDAKNEMWTADLLELIPTPMIFNDWYLPSYDELKAMRAELYYYDVGDFLGGGSDYYWSSTEYSSTTAKAIRFIDDLESNLDKSSYRIVRAIRSFTTSTIYTKRQTGPAGGLIFAVVSLGGYGYRVYEAAPEDIDSSTHQWSNITNIAIGSTSTVIGMGDIYTLEIINQTGHVYSAAKLCDDLSITI